MRLARTLLPTRVALGVAALVFGARLAAAAPLFSVSFGTTPPAAEGVSILAAPGFEFDPRAGRTDDHWAFKRLGSYFTATFSLPSPVEVVLEFEHLSSRFDADPVHSGYSPIDLLINGVAVLDGYDAGSAHGGTHDWVTDSFVIPRSLLQNGSNTIQVRIDSQATSQYWIRRFAASGERILTFKRQIRSKMFIAPIGAGGCDPLAVVVPPNRARVAAYMAYCTLTDSFFMEDPATGATYSPLDARIVAIVDLEWTCREDRTTPIAGSITPVVALGGPEPFGYEGVANPIEATDGIALDGTWAYTASGHPDPGAEPAFELYRGPRQNRDIWHRVAGSISCNAHASGTLTSTLNMRLAAATRFPSHRTYVYTNDGNPQFVRIDETMGQEAFSNLWFLPPVGATAFEAGNAWEVDSIGTLGAGCALQPPIAPEPLPDGFDWSPLADDWCSQLAACGYETSGCVESYLAVTAGTIPESEFPPAGESVASSQGTSEALSCSDSEEYAADPSVCAPEVATGLMQSVSFAILVFMKRRRKSRQSSTAGSRCFSRDHLPDEPR